MLIYVYVYICTYMHATHTHTHTHTQLHAGMHPYIGKCMFMKIHLAINNFAIQ